VPVYPKADVVLRGGRVFRSYGVEDVEAVALWSGKVLALGTSAEMEPLIGPRTKVVELAGRLAAPGLFEAHMHLLPLGLAMAEVDVRPKIAPTLDHLLGAIKAKADQLAPGEWVLARGYDQFKLDVKRHPHRTELDRAAPRNPVYCLRTDGHLAVCNSLALELAGITVDTPVPQGGAIEQANGELTGLLAENGRDAVKALLPEPSDAELVAAIERAARHCHGFGITSCMDAAVGMRSGYREIVAYRAARRTGRVPIRTNMCLLGGPGGILERCHQEGMLTGGGDDMLRVGPVKIFTDGSAGGRTAAMSEPYRGEPATKGLLSLTDAEMDGFTRDYHDKGYQLAIHAIGDAAIEQTLSAMEKALDATPDPGRRHRIEHCGFLTPGQMQRMKGRGIEPVPQPCFIYDFGDLYNDVVGPERAAASYPLRSWIDMGFRAAASTDCPVCDVDPFPNFYTMMTRKTARGTSIGAGEAIDARRALQAYTEFGAYVNRFEDVVGRLEPGMAADIAVFSRDLLASEPEEMLETRCDLTLLAGRPAHDRHGEMA
jgi:predicted amidohydrolase YtcJ